MIVRLRIFIDHCACKPCGPKVNRSKFMSNGCRHWHKFIKHVPGKPARVILDVSGIQRTVVVKALKSGYCPARNLLPVQETLIIIYPPVPTHSAIHLNRLPLSP